MSKLTETIPTYATLPIRLGLGSVMVAHGAQKVLGIWGGRGFNTWISGMPPFEFMRPTWLWMSVAAFAEFLGGIMIIFGLYTRVAAFFVACSMLTAVVGVHMKNGFFLAQGGIEFAMVLLAMAVSLLIWGGGSASADSRIG